MGLIEQAVEKLAVPSEADVKRRAECRCGLVEVPNGHAEDQPALDPRDLRPGHARFPPDIFLASLLADPEGAKLACDSHLIHRRSMAASA